MDGLQGLASNAFNVTAKIAVADRHGATAFSSTEVVVRNPAGQNTMSLDSLIGNASALLSTAEALKDIEAVYQVKWPLSRD